MLLSLRAAVFWRRGNLPFDRGFPHWAKASCHDMVIYPFSPQITSTNLPPPDWKVFVRPLVLKRNCAPVEAGLQMNLMKPLRPAQRVLLLGLAYLMKRLSSSLHFFQGFSPYCGWRYRQLFQASRNAR